MSPFVIFGPALPPPPPPDDPVEQTDQADAPRGEPETIESDVVSEPVNPAATTDPPPPTDRKATAAGKKSPPTAAAVARDSTVTPDKTPTKGKGRWQRPGTKQRFAFEFKMGPYLPEIDKAYDGPGFGPYATIFGRTNDDGETVKKPLQAVMPAAHFEYQFVYLGGPLAIGTQIAFMRDRADALLANPDPGENLRTKADKVTFGMVPLSLMLVYRFELAADFFKVPLVPYMKAGLTYAFWWMKDGTGKIARNEAGEKGHGGVLGWQLNPGVMIRMDFIEPGTAKKLDQATGINHTYVFGEFQLTRLRNFGAGNSIDLSDKTFFVGLAIEF